MTAAMVVRPGPPMAVSLERVMLSWRRRRSISVPSRYPLGVTVGGGGSCALAGPLGVPPYSVAFADPEVQLSNSSRRFRVFAWGTRPSLPSAVRVDRDMVPNLEAALSLRSSACNRSWTADTNA